MNLILIFPDELTPESTARLSDYRAAHIRNVLRAAPGKALRIGLLNGPLGTGTVGEISCESVALSCEWESAVPPRPPIDLLLAMPRPKVLKRLWAQLAAIGVGRIILTNAEKVERFYFDTHVLDPEFYNARLIEGLQQARDTRLPEVTVVKQLKPFLESEPFSGIGTDCIGAPFSFPKVGKKLIADPSGKKTISQCLEPVPQRCCLAIGPEGGWTPYELEMFERHGFETVGMGKRILRADTACIGLISLLAERLREVV